MKNTKQFTLVLVSKLKGLCNLVLTASSTFKHPAFFLNLLQSFVSPHIVSEVDYLSSTTCSFSLDLLPEHGWRCNDSEYLSSTTY